MSADATLVGQLDALLARFDRQGPGAVLGIARHGRTIYRKAVGLANVEHRVPMTPATRLAICSVTKHMTCAAVLQLAADGRLSIDDPVGRWLPELPALSGRATLRQLMTHMGGIRCHLDTAAFNGVLPQPVGEPLALQLRQTSVNFEPGEGLAYCNGGYVLLTETVERASGMGFDAFLRERLFAPLRMDDSSAPRRAWPLPEGAATGYLAHEGGWRHGFNFEDEPSGSGNAVSTVDDMLRWAQQLRESDGPCSLEALTAPAHFANGAESAYRFGLTVEHWRGLRLVEHGGGAIGLSCHLLIAPDQGLDLFVFCNSMEAVQPLAREAAALVLADALQADVGSEPVRSEGYQPLLGHYLDLDAGLVLGFADADGQLGVSNYGNPAVPALRSHLPTQGELPFHLPSAIGARLLRAAPDAADHAAWPAIEWQDGGRWRRMERLALAPADLPTLLAGLGGAEFFSEEAQARLRFEDEAGELLMRSCGDYGLWKFYPRSLTRELLGFSFYKGVASWLARLVWRDGVVVAIEMSSSRTRHLCFHRDV